MSPRSPVHFPTRLIPHLFGAPLAFALAASLASAPGLADDLNLARLAEHVDVALGTGRKPTGEFAASLALGELEMNLRHIEFTGGMAGPNLYVRPQNNPLVRSSLAGSRTQLDLGADAAMPLGLSFGLDEWDEGNRNFRLIAHNGLRLADLTLDHRMTLITSFAADGTQSQRGAGRLQLGFNLLGGRQQGVVEHDAAPQARMTRLRMNSEWRLANGGAAMVDLAHQPVAGLSEARVTFRQAIGGGIQLTSDLMADDAGGYAAGLRVALPLGPAPKRGSWSLSTRVASLRAEREAPTIVESDAYAIQDVN